MDKNLMDFQPSVGRVHCLILKLAPMYSICIKGSRTESPALDNEKSVDRKWSCTWYVNVSCEHPFEYSNPFNMQG